eukprot:TRINITY_DN19876_c0_g1_i2.p1 TRINITY_DN19876_c0_g1~~TRINITY_DN19876_c0_g1_i2.p1  ORF type:complete len:251 (-),score=38.78 TRINITY_DN19876_c0_g1_i2:1-753(-)
MATHDLYGADGKQAKLVKRTLKPNQTTSLEYDNGTRRQIDQKGVEVRLFADGKKETRYPSGDGDKYIVIQSAKDGSKLQTNPDGSTITSYPSGNKVQRMANGIFISQYSDQSSLQVDPDGREIRKWPTGELEVSQPDGTIIRVDSNGVKRTTYANGVSIESNKDGSKVQTNSDGSQIELLPDQIKIVHNTDGTRLVCHPDGRKEKLSKAGFTLEIQSGDNPDSPSVIAETRNVSAWELEKEEQRLSLIHI